MCQHFSKKKKLIQYQVLSVQYKPISVAEDKKCYDSSKKWHLFQISAHCTSLFKGELVRFWHFSIRSFRVHVSYQTFYFQRLTLRSSVMQPNMWSIKVLWISRALLMQWLLRPGEDKNGRKWFGTKMERWVTFFK